MANRKMNKLDMYAETRIWNLKLKNKNIATKDLVEEMIIRFNLPDKTSLYLELKKIILAARRRVMRRQSVMKRNISAWALKLFLPETLVRQWAVNGWLTEKNFKAVFEILTTYNTFLTSRGITLPD